MSTAISDEAKAARSADYASGRWCGECRHGHVEDPPCCWQPAEISDDVLDAATKALAAAACVQHYGGEDMARAVVAAALPHIREQIAAEIEHLAAKTATRNRATDGVSLGRAQGYRVAFRESAKIVRGLS